MRIKFASVFVALAIWWIATPGLAANGDNLSTIVADRTGTACASYNVAGDHFSVGVGIAFDGTNLLISCYGDSSVTEINPADGSQVAVHFIAGASSLGALAWDGTHGVLWGCSNFGTIGSVDLTGDSFTPLFDTYAAGGTGCFDGFAYDASDDSFWASGDVSGSVQHYSSAGVLLTSDPVTFGCGNSGIAVGGPYLYLANNGCSQIFEVAKDFSTTNLFASFPRRLEDLECDNLTFAGAGVGAIWSIDAYDNILNAWEIPADQCVFGGGGGGTIPVDIHPTSCRNPINPRSQGKVPVAINGTADLDVTEIDPSTILLEGVAPLKTSIHDVSTPYEPYVGKEDPYDCTTDGPDGYDDLVMHFDNQELVAAIGPLAPGDVLVLELTAETYDGTPLVGEDVVVVVGPACGLGFEVALLLLPAVSYLRRRRRKA